MLKLSTYQTSFASALIDAGVEFIVIGGMAMKAHGINRETIDLDIFVSRTNHNATRLYSVLLRFATAVDLRLTVDWLRKPMKQVPLFSTGTKEKEIDILTSIEGLSFRCAERRSMNFNFDLVPLKIIGLNDLLHTKRVAVSRTDDVQARDRDLQDIDLIMMHSRSL